MAGAYLSIILKSLPSDGKSRVVGSYAGFDIAVCRSQMFSATKIMVCGEMKYSFEMSEESGLGNILKIQNVVRGLEKNLNNYEKN